MKLAHPGAVAVIQRFGSAAELNWHVHALAADGVFTVEADDRVRFRALPAPTKGDILEVAWRTCQKTIALLRKQNRWTDAEAGELPDEDPLAQRDPLLAQCYAASLAGVLLFDGQRRPMRLFGAAAREPKLRSGYGFYVDAAVRVPGRERGRRERLCRYVLRPPLANDRLREHGGNRYELRLKKAWSDGTTALVLDGAEVLGRLAALVPPPRTHTVRYFGVFSSHAKLRSQVVPQPEATPDTADAGLCTHDSAAASPSSKRLPWAKLLARVFEIDVTQCPRCGAKGMQKIALVTQPSVIRAILVCVGLATGPPVRKPARVPAVQQDLEFVYDEWA